MLNTTRQTLDTSSCVLNTTSQTLDTSHCVLTTTSQTLDTSSCVLNTTRQTLDTSSCVLTTTSQTLDTCPCVFNTTSQTLDTSLVWISWSTVVIQWLNVSKVKYGVCLSGTPKIVGMNILWGNLTLYIINAPNVKSCHVTCYVTHFDLHAVAMWDYVMKIALVCRQQALVIRQ